MPRRPAKVTQADIARAIRAAKETGASSVVVDSYGRIHISVSNSLIIQQDGTEAWELSSIPKAC
jgi:hypothetical protein